MPRMVNAFPSPNHDDALMKIFVYIDAQDLDDLEDMATEVEAAITTWVQDCDCTAEAINTVDVETGEQLLGLRIDTSKKAVLKKALDFLYDLAKQYEQDFAVGYLDADSGAAHKVCYFGNEEGRPDISEIGSYLGLKK